MTMQSISRIQKAIAGFIFSAAGALATAASTDGIDQNEWYVILAAGLVTGAAVYYTPNGSGTPPQHYQPES